MKTIEELLESKGIIPERPPSLDEKGRRLDIHPAKVSGKFRSWRNTVYFFLLFVFLVIPWTRFAGEQTIHLDLAHRKFIFFGGSLFAHDAPLVFFLLGIVVFSLALATALYGRVWCGWACPQTVFIDTLYRKVEEWIEGNHIKRRKLARAPWSKDKLFKKIAKWGLFTIISSHIVHSFMAYFVGARELLDITLHNPAEHWGLFIAVQVMTLLTLLNFGWFREQFCMIACPYGRFQSVLLDERSKNVLYDYKRGEPRREKGKKEFADCIDCFKCVNVCPTGIDIRNGTQLECIGCTACIDACDEVMVKLDKPKGLIRYASEEEIGNEGKIKKTFNIRSLIYAGILSIFVLGLIISVSRRSNFSVKIIRAVEAPYQVSKVGDKEVVLNHFRLHVTNQSKSDLEILSFELDKKNIDLVAPNLEQVLTFRQDEWIHLFLKVPREEFKTEKFKVHWVLKYKVNDEVSQHLGELNLMGPAK
ncbi:MAG: cytochrome c oxidase accessory protein CcoG [Bdellovibrionales bacterium]